MYDDDLIFIGVICFAFLTVISSAFFHELGHFFAAKALLVSVKNIVFVSTLPRVNYQDPGEPIKDGLVYFLEAPRVHQNFILFAGPLAGALVSPIVYFAIQASWPAQFAVEIISIHEWAIFVVSGVPLLMAVINFVPVKFGEYCSDGYHLFHGPKKP